MIDIRAARNDPEHFRAALARKGADALFDELMAADAHWRELVPRVDELRARQKLDGKPTPDQIESLKQVKEDLRQLEDQLAAAEAQRDELVLRVPNLPHASVPDGAAEEDAQELRRVGNPPNLTEPKEHTDVGRFDMDRAARVSGSRFGYFVGDTALLALALYRYALERIAQKGFTPILPPVLVREEPLVGTGHFPAGRQDVYGVDDDGLYLAGTAEIPVASLHGGEILDAMALPLRYVAFSTCFRREAGAAGRDTRGMFRVHQFNKVEQFVYADPAESWEELERLLANTEELAQELAVPYRVVVLPAGDISAASAKTYDVELWFPAQGRYRETASISNTTDYQARRVNVRARTDNGTAPVHLLNGTAVTDRWALAILENFQGDVPDVLRDFGAPERVTA